MDTTRLCTRRQRSWAVSYCLSLLAASCLSSVVTAQNDSEAYVPHHPNSAAESASPTRVVSLFYIDERAYEGLPYTLFHRDSGAVVGVRGETTTFVITTTRSDRRPSPTHSRTDDATATAGVPPTALTAAAAHPPARHNNNVTGRPSTITQGPATFEFTGPRPGSAGNTVVNRCSLNGTVAAACNMTHVGADWYTADPAWNGTYSTSSYDWVSGDRFGFAPVTITEGVHMMGPPQPTISPSQNAAAAPVGGLGRGGAGGAVLAAGWLLGASWMENGVGLLFPAFVLAVAVAL